MNDIHVELVELPPMWVVSVLGFGQEPESLALDKAAAWAAAHGVDLTTRRMFGFNNPNPTPGSPHYGYEVWVEVEPGTQSGEGAEIKRFDGGLYAVTRVSGVEQIFPTWQRLSAWVENSRHRMGRHQWLEEHIRAALSPPDEFIIDLFLPLAE